MKLSKYIDHTLLKPDQTLDELQQLIDEAIEFDFKTVCVSQDKVSIAANSLKNSNVEVCTVIGFPLGNNTTKTKVFEALDAIENGADEIDMVLNISALKGGNLELVKADIKAVNDAVKSKGKDLKVIFETCLLSDEAIANACDICVEEGVKFVKTSTGFSTGGASVRVIELMKSIVGNNCGIKASGGVRTQEYALKLIEAGATRIGTSNGIAILKGDNSGKGY